MTAYRIKNGSPVDKAFKVHGGHDIVPSGKEKTVVTSKPLADDMRAALERDGVKIAEVKGDAKKAPGLTAEHRSRKYVLRYAKIKVGFRIEICVHVSVEIRGEAAGGDLTRERHIASCRYGGVVVHRRIRKSRLLRSRCKASEKSRHPEADAAFVGPRPVGKAEAQKSRSNPTGSQISLQMA